MGTELWAVACAVIASLLAAVAAFEVRRGAAGTRLALSLSEFRIGYRIVLAVFLFLLSSLFFLVSLRGAQLSVILPVTTLEYVWVLLLARYRLNETIGRTKFFGVGFIVVGLVLVGLGS